MGMTRPHVDPTPILLIKETHNSKPDKYFVKLKLRRDPTLSTSDHYEIKMSLFDNGETEEFLLFVCDLNMTLAASGTLGAGAKYQYLCTLVHGEALCNFDLLPSNIESMQTQTLMTLLGV